MICERCGKEISDATIICPTCGTLTEQARSAPQPPTSYGSYPQSGFGEPQQSIPYARGYTTHDVPPQRGYEQRPQQNYGYIPPAHPVNMTIINNPPFPGSSPGKNDGALIAEIILSLFGIFGIGWLMAGETTVGIVLLVASFLLYWPIMLLGTIFTLGLGLVCLGPLAISAIIVNAILLNTTLNRKARRVLSPMPPPPQVQPRQWQ